MFKKGEENEVTPRAPAPLGAAPSPPSRPASAGAERASIGPSIAIKGDVSGNEDLVIQGRIEGSVQLGQHRVTVGPEGRVKADISGRTVTVEGEVTGNLRGQEQVVLRSTARVEGDIESPRVVIEDGATFRGSIDMAPDGRGAQRSRSQAPEVGPKREPGNGGGAATGGDALGSSSAATA